MSAKLCCLLLLALGQSFVLAYPRFVTGCAQPVSALGPHAAPVQDASISIEITTLPPDFRGVLHSGTSYNLTLSAPSAARGLLIASSGSFASANGCSGRRLNLDAVATNHYATWTAGEEAPTFTVTFASSSTAPYRQHKRVLGEAPPVTPAAAPVVPPASTPVARSAAGSGLGDMAGMGPAAEVPGGSFVESMHVGVLHVDSMHTHDAHMSGGGSWAGHMIPAAFFILWGGYWAISSIVGVAHAATTLAPFKPRAWYPFLPNTLPLSSRLRRLEPILKVALPSFGAFCELYFHPPHPSFNSMWNADGRSFNEGHVKFWQHTMMYGFFILSGCVDLFGAPYLPPAAPMVVLSGAFFGEALLFYFHLSSQSGMLAEIHLLLVYSILFCAVSTAAEAVGGGSVAALARAFFTLLQGSWFVQITHTVYGRVPWPQDMATEMILPVIFCMHIITWGGVFVVANIVYRRFCTTGTVHDARKDEEDDI